MPGAGWAGAGIGASIGFIVVPGAIVAPCVLGMYAVKAVIHVKMGPEAAAQFGKQMEQNVLPKIVDFACNVGNAVTPVTTLIGAVTNPV